MSNAEDVFLTATPIRVFNPGPLTGAGNITWLLPGSIPTLIDAGTGDSRHLKALDEALGGARLAQVLVTHNHSDHASGVLALQEHIADVRFSKLAWPDRDSRYPVSWDPLVHGQFIDTGDGILEVIHTPGHAPDHVCFWHAETRTLFGGDLAIQGTTVVIPASTGGDLGAYLTSLKRVLTLQPARILPAHGPVITNPEELLRGYIRHRLEREQQILDALRTGASTVEEIVACIYINLQESLRTMAADSVLAHLRKLEQEQQLIHNGENWSIRENPPC